MKDKDNGKCYQYVITASFNHKQIERDSHKITKISPFRSQYEGKQINFRSHVKDCKKFERKNKSMTVYVFFLTTHKERD